MTESNTYITLKGCWLSANALFLFRIKSLTRKSHRLKRFLAHRKAILFFLRHFASLEAENVQLKTKNETLSTYVTGYNNLKNNSRTSAGLSLLSAVCVGFGVNYLTGDTAESGGWVLLIMGSALQIYAIYLSNKE